MEVLSTENLKHFINNYNLKFEKKGPTWIRHDAYQKWVVYRPRYMDMRNRCCGKSFQKTASDAHDKTVQFLGVHAKTLIQKVDASTRELFCKNLRKSFDVRQDMFELKRKTSVKKILDAIEAKNVDIEALLNLAK